MGTTPNMTSRKRYGANITQLEMCHLRRLPIIAALYRCEFKRHPSAWLTSRNESHPAGASMHELVGDVVPELRCEVLEGLSELVDGGLDGLRPG